MGNASLASEGAKERCDSLLADNVIERVICGLHKDLHVGTESPVHRVPRDLTRRCGWIQACAILKICQTCMVIGNAYMNAAEGRPKCILYCISKRTYHDKRSHGDSIFC